MGHLPRRPVVLLIEPRGLSTMEICPMPPRQIMSELGAVDPLYKEAVRDRVERFEMSTAMAIVLLGGLRWLKPETTLAETLPP